MQTVTLYQLTGDPTEPHDTETRHYFPAGAYSRMKHGDANMLKTFAFELAQQVAHHNPDLVADPAPLQLPVAYKHVPPACFYLAEETLRLLNPERVICGNQPGTITRIHKDTVTHTDYSTATPEQRQAELDRISFTLDQPARGAQILLIDDLRVTGNAEHAALTALTADEPANITLGYLATCDPDLSQHTEVEAHLNHAEVTSILDMLPTIQDNRFKLTIRFLKLALKSPELPYFLHAAPNELAHTMLNGAIHTGEDFCEAHAAGLETLNRHVWRTTPAHA